MSLLRSDENFAAVVLCAFSGEEGPGRRFKLGGPPIIRAEVRFIGAIAAEHIQQRQVTGLNRCREFVNARLQSKSGNCGTRRLAL